MLDTWLYSEFFITAQREASLCVLTVLPLCNEDAVMGASGGFVQLMGLNLQFGIKHLITLLGGGGRNVIHQRLCF